MIDALTSTPEIAVFFLILCGAAAGALIAALLLPSRREVKRLQAELDAARAEHQSYKGQVTSHFHRTAELVGVMTQSYKNVYDHLATGAQSLCDGPPALPAGFGEPRMIADSSFVVGDEAPEGSESAAATSEEGPTAIQKAHGDAAPTPTGENGTATEKRDWTRMEQHPPRASETQPAHESASDDDETRGNGADDHSPSTH